MFLPVVFTIHINNLAHLVDARAQANAYAVDKGVVALFIIDITVILYFSGVQII